MNELLQKVERRLDRLAAGDERVRRLQTIAGLWAHGSRNWSWPPSIARIAFAGGREVSAYVGLIPRQFESGTMSRQGRISKQGPSAVTTRLLVQIAWAWSDGVHYVAHLVRSDLGWAEDQAEESGGRRVARKILVWCWAMLRDGTSVAGSLAPMTRIENDKALRLQETDLTVGDRG